LQHEARIMMESTARRNPMARRSILRPDVGVDRADERMLVDDFPGVMPFALSGG